MSGPVAPVVGAGFQDNVFPIGFIKDEERIDLFKKISLYVRFMHFDGMSQLVVEMKCLGRHVASTVMSPHCELIYEEDSQRDISTMVRNLIKSPPDESGREWYRSVFNFETFRDVVRGICDAKKWEAPKGV